MRQEVKRIHPVPLLDATEGDEAVRARLLNECVSQEISVFVAIPRKTVAQTLGVAGYSGVVADFDDDETYEDSGRILIDYSYADSPVVDFRLRFVRLAASDLKLLLDKAEVQIGEFTNGGLAPAGIGEGCWLPVEERGYELKGFGRCRVVQHAGTGDPFGGLADAVAFTIKLEDLLVARENVSRIRRGILAALKAEDRWGHRKEAPIVHLIYRAAQHFAAGEYSFEAAKEWLQANDPKGFFDGKAKALDYAARLINRNPTKKSIESAKVLRLEKITENETGKNYTEVIASNRLRLLHLATDCWIHDKKQPGEKPYLPKGGLWGYLQGLGFTTTDDTGVVKGKDRNPEAKDDHVTNAKECQVAYLENIIKGGV